MILSTVRGVEPASSAWKAEVLASERTVLVVQCRPMGDRTSRTPEEAAEFQKKFEGFVKSLHPDYERNKLVRRTRLEYLRELLPGVFASHNVIYWRELRYYHCFCITLHRELPSTYLLSPLVIGGRFDLNNSVKLAYFRDVESNRRWPFGKSNFSVSHSYRSGWESIVEKCTRIAEDKMLPHYIAQVKHSKKPLLHLLETVLDHGEIPIEIDRGRGYRPCTLFPIDYDMRLFVDGYRAAGRGRDQFVSDIIHSKPELFNQIRVMKTLPDLLNTLRS